MLNKVIILSVIFENYDVFRKNYECIIRQNTNSEITFLIVDNTLDPDKSFIDEFSLKNNIIYQHNIITPEYAIKTNSFHHAIALDQGIKLIIDRAISSNLLVILDPDYFIFGLNWISSMNDFMKREGISFFGSPWANKWVNKYKNFPCVQCMLIDIKLLNDLPSFAPLDTKKLLNFMFWRVVYLNRYISHFVNKFFNHVFDTGSLIYYKFRNNPSSIFREINFNDLTKKKFFTDHSDFNLILLMIKKSSTQVEIFEFEKFTGVHFRSFGNIKTDYES